MKIFAGDFVAPRALRFAWSLQVALPALMFAAGGAGAQDVEHVYTNQSYVEDATHASTLAMDDPMAVFALVFNSLPERAEVYPTENYYYFRFIHAGTPYAGNLRFDPRDRDQGKVQFGYYKDIADWMGVKQTTALSGVDTVLDASREVQVERMGRLLYRINYKGKSVVFALNDLSEVKPPSRLASPSFMRISASLIFCPIIGCSTPAMFTVRTTLEISTLIFMLISSVPITCGCRSTLTPTSTCWNCVVA